MKGRRSRTNTREGVAKASAGNRTSASARFKTITLPAPTLFGDGVAATLKKRHTVRSFSRSQASGTLKSRSPTTMWTLGSSLATSTSLPLHKVLVPGFITVTGQNSPPG
jgi:hypothetical protein